MIAVILSRLFPPKLPGRIRNWDAGTKNEVREEGWAGNVRTKYRDGIDRFFNEEQNG